jgi:D-lactate dehydrogenase
MSATVRPGQQAPPPGNASDRAPDWVASGTPEPLRSQLVSALGADRVLSRATDLIAYAYDASPYRRIPKAVVMPRDIDDAVAVLAFARSHETPVVFRTGGTSLNGQAQTDSILVDVRRHWQRARVLDGGERIRVQPGISLGHVNRILARYGRKLGPDPASTDFACIGGVVSNNSGGMRCGTTADSYSTVRSLKLVLANGAVIDTAEPDAGKRFAAAAPLLAAGLAEIRDELRADAELVERVRRKFEIKNTTGYRLCAFLDADEPVEIFRRLVIGGEGTLAFIAEAVFETVPLLPCTTIALVTFEDIESASSAVPELVAAGATATELMVAPTLIAASYNMPGTPESWRELPPTAAALLVEFRADSYDELDAPVAGALSILNGRPLVGETLFTREPEEIEIVWRVREGMHGLLAAVRAPGVSIVIEDVCVPPERIAEAARDFQGLLGKHGFLVGVAGHASAGNLHFLLTPNFGEQDDLERYDAFMHELVDLVVDKYDGSLKAEHGTGINMAPFVEREWGSAATDLMWRVKALADPDGILGPGVVLNRDPGVHLQNLKSAPEIEEVATKCVECGYCEPVCPSRNVTTTPRQRIVLRREMARQPEGSPVRVALVEQFEYDAVQTCAADGSCGRACPVGIDTGKLVKQLRASDHSPRAERAALRVAQRYAQVERFARGSLRAARTVDRVGGGGAAAAITGRLRQTVGDDVMPVWPRRLPQAPGAPLCPTWREGAAAVYLPACINRIFGNPDGTRARPTLPEALVAVSARAGEPLWIPPDVAGVCCGVPWSSKGFDAGHEVMSRRAAEALDRWSDSGRLPVVIDASSCAQGLSGTDGPDGVEVLDSIAWIHDHVLPRVTIGRKLRSLAVHPTCSAAHLGLSEKLLAVARALADEVVVPAASGCCGMAGDRGWLHPELPASALRDVAIELDDRALQDCVSSNRTCEIALHEVTGRAYRSFVLVLEELTRP